MKINKILTAIFLLLTLNGVAQQTVQDSLTDYLQKYPATMPSKMLTTCIKKLSRNINNPLLIKALILKSTFSIRINSDDYTKILPELENTYRKKKILQQRVFCILIQPNFTISILVTIVTKYHNEKNYKLKIRKILQNGPPKCSGKNFSDI